VPVDKQDGMAIANGRKDYFIVVRLMLEMFSQINPVLVHSHCLDIMATDCVYCC